MDSHKTDDLSDTASEDDFQQQPSSKRRKLEISNVKELELNLEQRPISPPPLRRKSTSGDTVNTIQTPPPAVAKTIASPFHLTRVRDLPDSQNNDTITLHDIIGDESILELWHFNYLFDIGFLISALHKDVRHEAQVRVVHGFSRPQDSALVNLRETASRFANISLITAPKLPPFGTHHSKMMVIFRRDNTAQVVIHTANMISRDWANLTQAVWKSPLLPLKPEDSAHEEATPAPPPIGSGERFKVDLLAYLRFYEGRVLDLARTLELYDFAAIRGALIASVPSETVSQARWGWPRLKEIIKTIPVSISKPVIVAQVSSIATLGQESTWLLSFLGNLRGSVKGLGKQAIYKIIFPDADEIRRSLDGYNSGASIHTKIQSTAQQKQLKYLRPMLCYWAGDKRQPSEDGIRKAGRRRAAPHIKTYIRFKDNNMNVIEWAMVTSANLSTQAWGQLANKDSVIKVSSYEIGVIVWPELYETSAVMIPTFMTNTPGAISGQETKTVVGFRMPYDLPLVRYGAEELPWCATSDYSELDWKGQTWTHWERD